MILIKTAVAHVLWWLGMKTGRAGLLDKALQLYPRKPRKRVVAASTSWAALKETFDYGDLVAPRTPSVEDQVGVELARAFNRKTPVGVRFSAHPTRLEMSGSDEWDNLKLNVGRDPVYDYKKPPKRIMLGGSSE